MQIFLDCDGVLADFDTYSREVLGMTLTEYEKAKHKPSGWGILYKHDDFFFKLPKMPDADELVNGVLAMGFEPIILTGVPSQGDENQWATKQKLRWRDKHFPDLTMITCKSKEKFMHMVSGKHNVLIDDWNRYQSVWEDEGGTFILHTSASKSLDELEDVVYSEHSASVYEHKQDRDRAYNSIPKSHRAEGKNFID